MITLSSFLSIYNETLEANTGIDILLDSPSSELFPDVRHEDEEDCDANDEDEALDDAEGQTLPTG